MVSDVAACKHYFAEKLIWDSLINSRYFWSWARVEGGVRAAFDDTISGVLVAFVVLVRIARWL